MTPEQEKNMLAEISEYTQTELIQLAIRLQKAIEVHLAEKKGNKDAVGQLSRQNEALKVELESAGERVDPGEVEALKTRCAELEGLNTGLQRALASK